MGFHFYRRQCNDQISLENNFALQVLVETAWEKFAQNPPFPKDRNNTQTNDIFSDSGTLKNTITKTGVPWEDPSYHWEYDAPLCLLCFFFYKFKIYFFFSAGTLHMRATRGHSSGASGVLCGLLSPFHKN